MLILILFAFIAGVITVLSPCILPILPIVLSGSVGGGKRRPFGIVAGFITSFTFFTLALSTIVKATGLPSDLLRNVAITTIILLGFSMVLPHTQLFLERLFTRLSNYAPRANTSDGFVGGFVLGMTLGLVWAPCVGPILAAVITLAVTSSVNLAAVFITFAYSLGTAIPMFAIIISGRGLLQKNRWLLQNAAAIQRGFGVIMIAVGLSMVLQLDRRFQTLILEKFPQYGVGLTAIENNQFVQNQLNALRGEGSGLRSAELLAAEVKAPELASGGPWINSPPLRLTDELKGKVILIDFWTYSCINCIRTFPYLRQWYDTYKDRDFVIVGVHSPEFEFEKKLDNVQRAVTDFGLTYPVVLDNEFSIWDAYRNRAWPSHYLIDKNGYIRYVHVGEGNYDTTEQAIRTLLGEEAVKDLPATELARTNPNPHVATLRQTPETYLGWGRAASYTTENQILPDQPAKYELEFPLDTNQVGLSGLWTVERERVTADANDAKLSLQFTAKYVYLVMDTIDGQPKKVQVFLDGQPITVGATAEMQTPGVFDVTEARKYDVVSLPESGTHLLELVIEEGTAAFAFTFGS